MHFSWWTCVYWFRLVDGVGGSRVRWRQRCGSGRNRPINQACQPPQPRVHPRHVDTPDKQAINPALKEPLGSIPFIQPLSHVLRPLYCMHMCARQRRGAHFSPINHAPIHIYAQMRAHAHLLTSQVSKVSSAISISPAHFYVWQSSKFITLAYKFKTPSFLKSF